MNADLPPDVFHMGGATLRLVIKTRDHCEALSQIRTLFSSTDLPCRISRRKLHSGTRQKLVDAMQSCYPREELGIALLQGGKPFDIYSTDMEGIFRSGDLAAPCFPVLCNVVNGNRCQDIKRLCRSPAELVYPCLHLQLSFITIHLAYWSRCIAARGRA